MLSFVTLLNHHLLRIYEPRLTFKKAFALKYAFADCLSSPIEICMPSIVPHEWVVLFSYKDLGATCIVLDVCVVIEWPVLYHCSCFRRSRTHFCVAQKLTKTNSVRLSSIVESVFTFSWASTTAKRSVAERDSTPTVPTMLQCHL